MKLKIKSTARIPSDPCLPCDTLNNCLLSLLKKQRWNHGLTHENRRSSSSHSHFYCPSPTCLNAVFLCDANQVCMALTRMLLLKCFWGHRTLCKYKSAYISRVWVTFSFSILSLSIFFLQSLSVVTFTFGWNCFLCYEVHLWCFKCLISLFITTPSLPTHTRLFSVSFILSPSTPPSFCPTHFIPASHP